MNSDKINEKKNENIDMGNSQKQDQGAVNHASFLEYLWNQFIILFEQEHDKKISYRWFSSLKLTGWNEHKKILELTLPNKFTKEWIEENIITTIKKIFCRLLQEESIEIEFNYVKKAYNKQNDNQFFQSIKLTATETISNCQFIPGTSLLPNKNNISSYCDAIYTKDNFLITETNKEIIAAIQYYIGKNNLWTAILFIYGQSGNGKTHLLFALKHLLKEKKTLIQYIHAKDFLKKYIQAAKNKTIYKLEKEFKEIHILLIDDFEYLLDKHYTQEFFLQIIKDFAAVGKKIILTAKNHINKLSGIIPSLLDTLDNSLIFQYKEYFQEEIKNILLLKIKSYNYNFPTKFIDQIINIKNITMQQAENLIHKITAQSIISKKEISSELIIENIASTITLQKKSPITLEIIISKIEEYTEKNIKYIVLQKTNEGIQYKYIAIYVARKIYHIPCNTIAQYFKYKDHTTISYACKKCLKLKQENENIKNIINLFH